MKKSRETLPKNGSSTLFRSIRLSFANTFVSRIFTFALGLVLARLLTPNEFGAYAAALVVQMWLLSINDIGAAPAIMRYRGDVRAILPTAWTVSIIGGAVLTAGLFLASPLVAGFFKDQEVAGIIRVMSFNLFVDGIIAVPAGLLNRNLQQGKRLIADALGNIGTISVAFMAFSGLGAYALAIGHVFGSIIVAIALFIFARARPKLGFKMTTFNQISRLGVASAASTILFVAVTSAPQVVAGSLLGTTILGFVYLGSTVSSWPSNLIVNSLERIMMPIFARANISRASAIEVFIEFGFALALPPIAFLVIYANEIVSILYGESWLPAAIVVQCLSIVGLIRVVSQIVSDHLYAEGRARRAVGLRLIWVIPLIPASIAGAQYGGLSGLALAQTTVAVLIALPVHLIAAHKLAPSERGRSYRDLIRLLILAAGLTGALVLSRILPIPPWAILIIGGTGAGLCFLVMVRYTLAKLRIIQM